MNKADWWPPSKSEVNLRSGVSDTVIAKYPAQLIPALVVVGRQHRKSTWAMVRLGQSHATHLPSGAGEDLNIPFSLGPLIFRLACQTRLEQAKVFLRAQWYQCFLSLRPQAHK